MFVDHFNVSIDGRTYTIYGISDKTRNGFYHKATLGDHFYKINYLNRTWECFQFETVIRELLKEVFGKNTVDFSKSKRGRKVTIYPKNLDEILEKIHKRDESNTNLIYEEPPKEYVKG